MGMRRKRSVHSVHDELVRKSKEAALAAVQIFNSPTIHFKSELFVVTIVIAWTYLLHAHYRRAGIEYRYFQTNGNRKRFVKSKSGGYRYWDLQQCLTDSNCPLDNDTINNLEFLLGLRHEIEHQMTRRIDKFVSAKFQACCLNYNRFLKQVFGPENGIDNHLQFSLQFSSIDTDQLKMLKDASGLPRHIESYISRFETLLTEDEFNSNSYAYRVLFVPKTANRRGQSDQVIEFIRSDSDLAQNANVQYALLKETEKPKYRPKQIVSQMKREGFKSFSYHHHTTLWQSLDAKDETKGYGVKIADSWFWYDKWIDEVRKHCRENLSFYEA